MADPNRTVPQKDRNPHDEELNRKHPDRQRSHREPASIAHDHGERIRRRRTGDDEPLADEGQRDIVADIEDEGLGRSDR